MAVSMELTNSFRSTDSLSGPTLWNMVRALTCGGVWRKMAHATYRKFVIWRTETGTALNGGLMLIRKVYPKNSIWITVNNTELSDTGTPKDGFGVATRVILFTMSKSINRNTFERVPVTQLCHRFALRITIRIEPFRQRFNRI